MVNEIYTGNESTDTSESVRKDIVKVTEQDVKRAQWDTVQAKKTQEEIKKSKIKNNNIAKFLEFLLKKIKNEELISSIYNTFFRVTDPKTKTVYLRKSVNDLVIVWFFAPFFVNEIEKFWLNKYYIDLIMNKSSNNITEYMEYIKNLSKKYHDNIPINKDNLLNLLSLIIWEFGINKDALTESWRDKVKKEIEKKLK